MNECKYVAQKGLISVIVPVYNCENKIVRCIDSILAQSYGNIEIIIIDDASTDHTCQICNEKYSEMKNVIFRKKDKNEGVAAARNNGIIIAKGEYLAFCDADDWMESEMLRILYDKAESANADIVSCALLCSYWRGRKSDKSIIEIYGKKNILNYIMQNPGFVWNKLYRRSSIENVRFQTELILCEDFAFLVECVLKGQVYRWIEVPDKLYHYEDGGITKGASNKHFKNNEFAYRTAMRYVGDLAGEPWLDYLRHKTYMLAVVEKDSDWMSRGLTEKNRAILDKTIIWARKGFLIDHKITVKDKVAYLLRDRMPWLKGIIKRKGRGNA